MSVFGMSLDDGVESVNDREVCRSQTRKRQRIAIYTQASNTGTEAIHYELANIGNLALAHRLVKAGCVV